MERRATADAARRVHLDGERVHPHPGPKGRAIRNGKAERLAVGTLNAPGIHVQRRDAKGAAYDEGWGDGWDLITKPSAKLKVVRDMVQQRGLSITVLTETRLRGNEMEAVRGHFRRVGYEHRGLPGREDTVSGHAVWGVSVVFSP